jgi:hypothetical protein
LPRTLAATNRHATSTRWRNHDREHVPIAVRVDANQVIHLVCKHPLHPPTPI